jgi:hypothetical protein
MLSPPNKPTLKQTLDSCSELHVNDNGCWAYIRMTATRRTPEAVEYTPNEMAGLDPRLYPALLATRHATNFTGYAILQTAKLCMTHWHRVTPIIAVVDSCIVNVAQITQIDDIDETLQTVRVKTNSYDVVTFDGVDDIAIPSKAQQYRVSFQWMDHHYPGSMGRMQVVASMDLTGAHFLRYVLHAETATPVVLPSLLNDVSCC